MIKTPIAIFTYNRPRHTHQMLTSLETCSHLDECTVVIFSDGPSIPEHVDGVEETRKVIHAWGDRHQAKIIERGINLGLARSIVDGVSELCEQNGRVIVLEDDLVLHPAFVNFMLSALDRYSDDEHVAQISGYMFPVRNPLKPDACFLPFISTWGWGTWSRAWKLFNWDASSALSELQIPETRHHFDLEGAYPYSRMLFNRLEGRNQSWGILFYWAVFEAKMLALYPRHSLINNIGFDSGTHFHKDSVKFSPLTDVDVLLSEDVVPVWPESSTVDTDTYQRIQEYLRITLQAKPRSPEVWWQRLVKRFLLSRLISTL